MHRLLFVVNPISGGESKDDFIKEIKPFCMRHGFEHQLYETTGKHDEQRIKENIKAGNFNAVIACGGDGTINLVARIIMKMSLTLGIIPFGSANGMATELNIPNDPVEALDVIAKGFKMSLNILQVGKEHYSLHLSDAGFNAKLIQLFEKGTYRGKVAYAFHFFKTLFKKRPIKYHFDFKSRKYNQRAEMVVFANATKYGTGAIVNPKGDLNDDFFEVCIFKPHPWYAPFKLAFQLFAGRLNRSKYVNIVKTDYLKLQSRKKFPVQVDGELIGEVKEIIVKMRTERLQIYIPENR